MAVNEQKNQELERGRLIAGRAKRQSDLDRYVDGKKVKIMVALPGHPLYVDTKKDRQDRYGQTNLFYVDGVQIAHQNTADDDYPSEGVMAVIAMAVGATVGFDGIPEVRPTHHVSEESKSYAAALRAANKGRPDIK